jgi:hypothetical protein
MVSLELIWLIVLAAFRVPDFGQLLKALTKMTREAK